MSNRISNSIRAVIGCIGLRLTVVCFVFILGAPRAQADVGVPMLAVMAVPMWLSLLVIIPLEAAIARSLLSIRWSRCFKLSILANLASTLLGIPVTWCALAAAEWAFGPWLVYGFQQQFGLRHKVTDIMSVILFSPWLLPINSDLYWMVPTASLVLCIPFFFASVWSENLVARKILESGLHNQALNWAWKANIASYILIALTAVGFLMVSLDDHNKVASDDEHRNVDLVSIDRLWDIAVAKAKDAKHTLEVSNQEYAIRHRDDPPAARPDEADRYYYQGRYAQAKPFLESATKLVDQELDRIKYDQYESPEYDLRLGTVYEKLGESGKAEQFYRHVVNRLASYKDPNREHLAEAIVAYADLCKKEGRLGDAEGLYKRAAKIPYTDEGEAAQCKLARCFCSQKRYNEAEQLLIKAIQEKESGYAPSEFPVHSAVGQLSITLAECYMDEGNLILAEHWDKEALRGRGALKRAAEDYAVLLERQGKLELAKVWHVRAKSVSSLEQDGY